MPQRIAIFAASLATALVVAAGLAIAGLGPSAVPAEATAASGTIDAAGAPATPVVQVDTIYVAPQPSPQEIVVKQTSAKHGDDDEGEHEGEDD